jgi:hypothetical protein
MADKITAEAMSRRHVRRKDRILLVNPPVEETRYSWLRWSQPLDLLKIGSFLRAEVGCDVALLDFLQPNAKGDIEEKWLPPDRRHHTVGGHRYPMRHFGKPFVQLREWVEKAAKQKCQRPTQVWITSLCTFWHDSTAEMCRVARGVLPDSTIALTGHYPRLLPTHAATTCAADYVITKALDTTACRNSLDLYERPRPGFVAVQAASPQAVTDIKAAVDRRVFNVAFFEEDLLAHGVGVVRSIIDATENLHRHVRYHFLSGIDPKKMTPPFARLFRANPWLKCILKKRDRSMPWIWTSTRVRVAPWRPPRGIRCPRNSAASFGSAGRERISNASSARVSKC